MHIQLIQHIKKVLMGGLGVLLLILCGCSPSVENERTVASLPDIYPDYTKVTIPVNIGPMNFSMTSDDYDAMSVIFRTPKGEEMEVKGDNYIDIDANDWQDLMSDSQNDSLMVTVRARNGGKWESFKPFPMYVKSDSIDYGIIYRRIAPGYQTFSRMGVYEYALSDLKEKSNYLNTEVSNSCVNCHTTCKGDPKFQSLHIRGEKGGTVIIKDGKMATYNTKIPNVTVGSAVYPCWHPSGNFIAYSTNNIHQSFSTSPVDLMESYDLDSDLYIYDFAHNAIILSEALMDSTMFETYPAFSADGKTMYFCRAKKVELPTDVQNLHYDLCSISFDPATGKIGEKIDTVICASKDSLSITLPRPSWDGRYLVYCKDNFGCKPETHHETDLWILDLKTGESRCMSEINSPDFTDGFHNWSSNNRWMVFESRREDGTHQRPYFAYVDKNGVGRKPFLMPQHDPKDFYAELMMSYNCVEFVKGPCKFDAKEAVSKFENGDNIQWQTEKNK